MRHGIEAGSTPVADYSGDVSLGNVSLGAGAMSHPVELRPDQKPGSDALYTGTSRFTPSLNLGGTDEIGKGIKQTTESTSLSLTSTQTEKGSVYNPVVTEEASSIPEVVKVSNTSNEDTARPKVERITEEVIPIQTPRVAQEKESTGLNTASGDEDSSVAEVERDDRNPEEKSKEVDMPSLTKQAEIEDPLGTLADDTKAQDKPKDTALEIVEGQDPPAAKGEEVAKKGNEIVDIGHLKGLRKLGVEIPHVTEKAASVGAVLAAAQDSGSSYVLPVLAVAGLAGLSVYFGRKRGSSLPQEVPYEQASMPVRGDPDEIILEDNGQGIMEEPRGTSRVPYSPPEHDSSKAGIMGRINDRLQNSTAFQSGLLAVNLAGGGAIAHGVAEGKTGLALIPLVSIAAGVIERRVARGNCDRLVGVYKLSQNAPSNGHIVGIRLHEEEPGAFTINNVNRSSALRDDTSMVHDLASAVPYPTGFVGGAFLAEGLSNDGMIADLETVVGGGFTAASLGTLVYNYLGNRRAGRFYARQLHNVDRSVEFD